jgi:hypothetical protein
MESRHKWWVTLLIAGGLSGCAMVPPGGDKAVSSGPVIKLGLPQPCPTRMVGQLPVCEVDVAVTSSGGICVASLTGQINYTGTQGNGSIKPLVIWTLKPVAVPATLSFAFQDKSGFLKLEDLKSQIDGSGPGDGFTGPLNPMRYFARNLRTVLPSEVTYLPIILQTDASTNPPTVSLCAVRDPKIVNMN